MRAVLRSNPMIIWISFWFALGHAFDVRECRLPLTDLTDQPGRYKAVFTAAKEFQDGCDIDNFDVGRTLGHGHFGVVNLAVHRQTEKKVAIKFQQHESSDWNHFNRNEECIQHELSHPITFPFIVQHHCTMVLANGTVGYVMEYVEGTKLSQIIKKKADGIKVKALDLQKLMAQLALTLQFIHSHNIVMADLKPGNLMITKEGDIKMIDFGLAVKTLEDGQVLKTPEWISYKVRPEYGSNPAVDWYAYGCLLYEVLNGRGIFEVLKGNKAYKSPLIRGKFCPDSFDQVTCDFIQHFSRVPWEEIWGVTRESRQQIRQHQFFSGFDWTELDALQQKYGLE